MAKQDIIQWEILEDGTISIQTDQVSGVNHKSADDLLKMVAEMAGGAATKTKRSKFHVHADIGAGLRQHAADGHVHQ